MWRLIKLVLPEADREVPATLCNLANHDLSQQRLHVLRAPPPLLTLLTPRSGSLHAEHADAPARKWEAFTHLACPLSLGLE